MTIFHVLKYGHLDPFDLNEELTMHFNQEIILWYNTDGIKIINNDVTNYRSAKMKKFHQMLLEYEGPL